MINNNYSKLIFSGKPITLFTQLLWSNATAIGCGASCFALNGYRWFEIVCNYAAGNVDGSPVYLDSMTAGSGCTTGTDATYKALCSNNEPLDANYRPSSGTGGLNAANFSTNYCTMSCGTSHIGCNATNVSFSMAHNKFNGQTKEEVLLTL